MSGLLPSGTLAIMRSLLPGMLHTTCEIRATASVGGLQAWPAGVTVPCMKGNPSRGGDADIAYDGDAPNTRFWVPVGTVVASGYQLIWEGDTYAIEKIPTIHADEQLRPLDCIAVFAPGATS